ncbi:MAG: hypothetical protein IJ935_06860 [Afipia sp.]|nr:hypothetical protein [Afipia sp.]
MNQTARARGRKLPIRDINDGKQVRYARSLRCCRVARDGHHSKSSPRDRHHAAEITPAIHEGRRAFLIFTANKEDL